MGRHSHGSHGSHGSRGSHVSGFGHYPSHHNAGHGHARPARQPSPSRVFYPQMHPGVLPDGRMSEGTHFSSRRSSEAGMADMPPMGAAYPPSSGPVGPGPFGRRSVGSASGIGALAAQQRHDQHYRQFQQQQQQQQQQQGLQQGHQQGHQPFGMAPPASGRAVPPSVSSPVRPMGPQQIKLAVVSTADGPEKAPHVGGGGGGVGGDDGVGDGAAAAAGAEPPVSQDGDGAAKRQPASSSNASSASSGAAGVTLTAASTAVSRAAMDAAVTDSRAAQALAEALAGVKAVTGASFQADVEQGRRASGHALERRLSQPVVSMGQGRPSMGVPHQQHPHLLHHPQPQMQQHLHPVYGGGPGAVPTAPRAGRPSWENRVAVAPSSDSRGGSRRESGAHNASASAGANTDHNLLDDSGHVDSGDPFASLRVAPDLLCPTDEPPRYDFLLSLRADLTRLRTHPLLASFPVDALLERLESAQAHFHGSNMSGTPFRGPLDAVLSHLGRLINAPSVRGLLQPVEARLKTIEERVRSIRGVQEAARAREDVNAEKAAVIGEIDTLRRLMAEHRATRSIIEASRSNTLSVCFFFCLFVWL
jgi:hypothetical protein